MHKIRISREILDICYITRKTLPEVSTETENCRSRATSHFSVRPYLRWSRCCFFSWHSRPGFILSMPISTCDFRRSKVAEFPPYSSRIISPRWSRGDPDPKDIQYRIENLETMGFYFQTFPILCKLPQRGVLQGLYWLKVIYSVCLRWQISSPSFTLFRQSWERFWFVFLLRFSFIFFFSCGHATL